MACSERRGGDPNQHQNLLQQLFRISQTSTVVDYVERFANLYDQISTYEEAPNHLHYTTRFLDGLKPGVRVAVALWKPRDLDAAYDLVFLHEELGEGITQINSSSSFKVAALPLPLHPKARLSDDQKMFETLKQVQTGDRCYVLRTYRKSKELCFVCGEKWSTYHTCKSYFQLYVVQELIEHIQSAVSTTTEDSHT